MLPAFLFASLLGKKGWAFVCVCVCFLLGGGGRGRGKGFSGDVAFPRVFGGLCCRGSLALLFDQQKDECSAIWVGVKTREAFSHGTNDDEKKHSEINTWKAICEMSWTPWQKPTSCSLFESAVVLTPAWPVGDRSDLVPSRRPLWPSGGSGNREAAAWRIFGDSEPIRAGVDGLTDSLTD